MSSPARVNCPDSRPDKCPMTKLPTELLILVASYLKKSDLRNLSVTSKDCSDVALEILYRDVDLGPQFGDEEAVGLKNRISRFLLTICSKPHLAAKVNSLMWWPITRTRLLSMHPEFANMGFDLSTKEITLPEYDIAAMLLHRLSQLKHLSFYFDPKYHVIGYPAITDNNSCPIFVDLLLRTAQIFTVAGLSNLKSIYVMQRRLDWQSLVLPYLQSISLGPGALIQRPRSPSMMAPNITSLNIAVDVCDHGKLQGSIKLRRILPRLPSLRTLSLHSERSYKCPRCYDCLGHFDAATVYTLLNVARSAQVFKITYEEKPRFVANKSAQLTFRGFANLRKIQMAENAFVTGTDVGVIDGVTTIMWPAQVLPSGIENLVITHPCDYFDATASPELCLLGWLEKLNKCDFPDLRRIEVICPAETVNALFGNMRKAYDDSEIIRKLREASLEIVVILEEIEPGRQQLKMQA